MFILQPWKFTFSVRQLIAFIAQPKDLQQQTVSAPTAFCIYLKGCALNAKTKELEENMRKFQASLKDVDLTSRVEYSWQILKECMDDNEKCLDMFKKKWENFADLKEKQPVFFLKIIT